jgi:hypothetical protein
MSAMLSQAVIGDTIRLSAEFKDWDGLPADLDDVTITIYDQNKEEMESFTPIRDDVGKYYYDYTVKLNESVPITFEYKGMLSNTPITRRMSFIPVWE